jgi:hypothetical protein
MVLLRAFRQLIGGRENVQENRRVRLFHGCFLPTTFKVFINMSTPPLAGLPLSILVVGWRSRGDSKSQNATINNVNTIQNGGYTNWA